MIPRLGVIKLLWLIDISFNILKDSNKGDAVIRHRIDGKGVEIAYQKGVSSIITQDISKEAIEQAKRLNLSLIITDKPLSVYISGP